MERSKKRSFKQEPASKDSPWWKRLWGWTEFGKKPGWDWLQLLIVPAVLAIGGYWFAAQQDARQHRIEERRAQAEQKLEEQRTQDVALQAYLDQMTQLMLERNLRGSEEDSEVRTLARARTLAVLGRLDPNRRKTLLRFLYEADLINRPKPVISLEGANLQAIDLTYFDLSHGGTPPSEMQAQDDTCLTLGPPDPDNIYGDCGDLPPSGGTIGYFSPSELHGIDLSGVDLRYANLSWTLLYKANLNNASLAHANLRHAILIDAELYQADLRNADLSDADLTGAYLGWADLTGATGLTDEEIEQQACSIQEATMPGPPAWTMTWEELKTCEQKRAAGKDGEKGGPS